MKTLALLLLAAAASAGSDPARSVPTGNWGAEHVALLVHAAGATLEMDCAHGTIDQPLVLDAHDQFDLPGTLTSERGPTRKDGAASQAVHYVGRLVKSVLTLSIRLENEETVGPYDLGHGKPARLRKCR